ncbi:hypothetical protein AMECASPLE_038222, partial [Ameca splendens]
QRKKISSSRLLLQSNTPQVTAHLELWQKGQNSPFLHLKGPYLVAGMWRMQSQI